MTACTDDERRRVARKLREYASWDGEEDCLVDCADWGESVLNLLGCGDTEGECYAALADLIEPDTTMDTTKGIELDAFSHGIESIYDWCREHLEGADGAEDDLYCSIMCAIEEYRYPERATAHTVRAVDRDALLELADEMEIDGAGALDDGDWCKPLLVEYAHRIREACGESPDGD